MHIEQLKEVDVAVENVYLDPNNPRFWSENTRKDVPDRKITDVKVQANTLREIEEHGLQELRESVLRNGFLPLDRIVVRPIAGNEGKYVVVEGNRRLAALKTLRDQIDNGIIDEEHISDEYLEQLKEKTNVIEVLVYSGADTADISWLLQGIRHISGIRPWQPAQRARLVATQIDKEKKSFKEAGQQFGLSAQAVGRYYRSFKALEQMRSDDEFQGKAKNEYFTLFEEAIRNKDVKQWLGWSEGEQRFCNDENLHQFYSWIVPDDEDSTQRRRVHDPRQIKDLGILIASGNDALLSQVDQHSITIEQARDRAMQAGGKYDWESALTKATALIGDLPQSSVAENPKEVIAALNELIKKIERLKKMAKSMLGSNT
jgi:hypothetical protein